MVYGVWEEALADAILRSGWLGERLWIRVRRCHGATGRGVHASSRPVDRTTHDCFFLSALVAFFLGVAIMWFLLVLGHFL